MKEIILVKFGGAILTEKKEPCTIRQGTLDELAQQLSRYNTRFPGKIVLGNGGGSFGHYYASEFDLVHGIDTSEKLMGFCLGKSGNAYLNWELVQSLLRYQVPACACPIGHSFSNSDRHLDQWAQLISYLECGILPVLYGDMVYAGGRMCQIISTEEIFLSFAKMLAQNHVLGYQVEKIIFCTDREGVEDSLGNIISVIERKSFKSWDIFWHDKTVYNVTGGMFGKVKMSFELQCPVQIINGNNLGNLERALNGDLGVGTTVV